MCTSIRNSDVSRSRASNPPAAARWLAVAATLVATTGFTQAQCALQWQPGSVSAGVNGYNGTQGVMYASTVWDPDGAGPAPALLVLAGLFATAGGTSANNIAAYDPVAATWSSLGAGTNNRVRALAVLASGELVAGGAFTSAGGITVNGIATWNGAGWSGVGGGVTGSSGEVRGLAALRNGDLVAGGFFTTAGTTSANNIARWDATAATWSALGSGVPGGVYSLAVRPNGDVIAGSLSSLTRWDGATWSSTGTLSANGAQPQVNALAIASNGDVLAAGAFLSINGQTVNRVARWNGTTWSALGVGSSVNVAAIGELANGDVVAGGQYPGSNARFVARWNGSAWNPMAGGTTWQPQTFASMPNGTLVAGGVGLLFWNGASWSALPGVSAATFALASKPDGRFVAGGRFLAAGGQQANLVAEWDGSNWNPLGPGIPLGTQASNALVTALCAAPNGDVFAGGSFGSGTSTQGIARWNGSSWNPMASGVIGQVLSMALMPNGDLIVGGIFQSPANNIARWDGSAWHPLGQGIGQPGVSGNIVRALAVLPNGDLVAGGSFSIAGGVNVGYGIARWNGATWAPMGLNSGVDALTVRSNGDLIASSAGLLRWNGTAWSPLGATSGATALMSLPNGDVVATGSFTQQGGVVCNGIARWNGSVWSAFGTGLAGGVGQALAVGPLGELAVGGDFRTVNGGPSAFVARLRTPCLASAVSQPSGCTAGGPTLTADRLPWVGGTFRSSCSGMAATSIGLAALGASPLALPLSLVHPAGAPGCLLLASPDITLFVLPVGGTATLQFGVPNDSGLVGGVLRHQMLECELSGLNLTSLESSNGLTLTVGMF